MIRSVAACVAVAAALVSGCELEDSPNLVDSDNVNADKVTVRVWGTAPNGVDITYGTDTTNLDGRRLPFTKTMKFDESAMWYQVTAQLQGGGNVHCSVTVGDQTKKGQARGGYNICSSQITVF